MHKITCQPHLNPCSEPSSDLLWRLEILGLTAPHELAVAAARVHGERPLPPPPALVPELPQLVEQARHVGKPHDGKHLALPLAHNLARHVLVPPQHQLSHLGPAMLLCLYELPRRQQPLLQHARALQPVVLCQRMHLGHHTLRLELRGAPIWRVQLEQLGAVHSSQLLVHRLHPCRQLRLCELVQLAQRQVPEGLHCIRRQLAAQGPVSCLVRLNAVEVHVEVPGILLVLLGGGPLVAAEHRHGVGDAVVLLSVRVQDPLAALVGEVHAHQELHAPCEAIALELRCRLGGPNLPQLPGCLPVPRHVLLLVHQQLLLGHCPLRQELQQGAHDLHVLLVVSRFALVKLHCDGVRVGGSNSLGHQRGAHMLCMVGAKHHDILDVRPYHVSNAIAQPVSVFQCFN
mmetsp:Transcript_17097/g.42855  ORF Transcript_17097/g.42855 Transcript_17097/m.42855 type:complete len:401 (-) Transcript_17097:1380-2582(-)